jgi:hypothetical protein
MPEILHIQPLLVPLEGYPDILMPPVKRTVSPLRK